MKILPQIQKNMALISVAKEDEARATALKHVANMLQRPDQLEKVEQYKRKVARKKASVEAMLKTTMQSQLDGVKTGVNHLQTALHESKDIKKDLREVETVLYTIPPLSEKLQDVREESMRHSQYAAAMENLKHIFNVPGSVQQTQEFINDGKLLLAHQRLSDLENSRDDLLFEMHKLPKQSPTDRNMLKHYFSDVEKLSDDLGKQLWLIVQRTLNSVRKEPQIIVTALRIIEREEKVDAMALARQKSTGFLPPGRPKQWKKHAFEVLEEAVLERIEGNQLEERHENKMWLVRHLEVIRQLVLEDLKVVKTACVPCFPPAYEIVTKSVEMYHNSLSKHFNEIVKNGLEGNEYITLLTWVNLYSTTELMGHPDLNIDVGQLKPLLDNYIVQELLKKYLDKMKRNYQDWMKNTLATEVKDWMRSTEPESDSNGYFHTSLPVIVIQMVDQHLQVAKTVSQDLVNRVMLESITQIVVFSAWYKDEIRRYREKHFEDRSQIGFFTHYMIAVTNNCQQFKELIERLYKKYWRSGKQDAEAEKTFQKMMYAFEAIREETISHLLDELFLDLDKTIVEVMTKKWQTTDSSIIDTLSATLEDYCHDYTHLWPRNFDFLMTMIEKRVAVGYILALLQRKSTFRNYDERLEVAEKFQKEGEQLQKLFARLSPLQAKWDSPFDAIALLSEVLRLKDASMLSLEISGLVKRYSDISADQLMALVALRGDTGKAEARQMIMDILPTAGSSTSQEAKTIFSNINLS